MHNSTINSSSMITMIIIIIYTKYHHQHHHDVIETFWKKEINVFKHLMEGGHNVIVELMRRKLRSNRKIANCHFFMFNRHAIN